MSISILNVTLCTILHGHFYLRYILFHNAACATLSSTSKDTTHYQEVVLLATKILLLVIQYFLFSR